MANEERFHDRSLAALATEVAEEPLAPAGGSVAAISTALAAGLVEKAARLTVEYWDEAPGTAAQAQALRSRALLLAETDAVAYNAYIEARREPRGETPEERDAEIGRALETAANPPLAIAETAADVVELAALAVERADQSLAADVTAALLIAEAAARAAAQLVHVNLATYEGDERVSRADELVDVCSKTVRRSLLASADAG